MSIFKKSKRNEPPKSVWARPNMTVIFRQEVMPGRSRQQRTFVVEKVLPNGRVNLRDFAGEHHENAFEALPFNE